MPFFMYEGRDHNGILRTERRLSHSADSLGSQLINEGIIPIKIILAEDAENLWHKIKIKLFEKPVTLVEIGAFSRQMYTLCKTGVPIAGALRNLAENIKNKIMSDALHGMVEHLESGQDLATSMAHYPAVFKPIMISMVRVGQSSGKLADAFLQINRYIELEAIAIKNVKTALRYPMFILIALLTAIVVINIFVIPSFATVFSQAQLQLPWATRFLIGMSSVFIHSWIYLFIAFLCAAFSSIYYFNTDKGKYVRDKILLKVPVFGSLLKRIIILRFAQTFAVIINSGIPLIDGIQLVSNAVNNFYVHDKILAMRDAIERGHNLTQAAAVTGLFSSLELQMFHVSEETGELSDMLSQLAAFYQREVDYELKRLADVVEPILIVVLSGVILVLAFAVYLPIWNMVKLAKVA